VERQAEDDFFAGCQAAGLEEVLAEREDRVRRQGELLGQFGSPLICLTLNIPGPYKIFPWARRCFFEGMETLKRGLEAEGVSVRYEESSGGRGGYRAFVAAAGDGLRLKTITLQIEETHPLGRLFDIDVLEGGGKIKRTVLGKEERKCLVCGDSAFACGRSRAHTVEELTGAVLKIMEHFFRENLGNIISGAALGALMGEVAVTPKPGLVDRAGNGAHRDMDFFTFIDSAAAVLPYFRDCALTGFESPSDPAALFNSLRFRGKIAELDMRKASRGVNTHRGLIFSLGIISAAFGRLYRREEKPALEDTLALCRAMTARLGEDLFRVQKSGPETDTTRGNMALSHGETVYIRHGMNGIRGEVSRGFPAVLNTAFPVLCRLLDEGHSLNDAGTAALLHLLAITEDTNIVHRSSPEKLGEIQKNISAFLAAKPSVKEILKKAAELDREFIREHISPGGSADLLAVTLFLYRLFKN
jgi:holo-ACP synthase/triphosphoribosyl-dephospho-CoA synthase